VVHRLLPAAALVLHRMVVFIYLGAQAAARGGARCESKVLIRYPLAVARGAVQVVEHGGGGGSRTAHARRSRNFTFSLAAKNPEFPYSVAAFVVNSEPNTGARPSVRLCVGLITGFICAVAKWPFAAMYLLRVLVAGRSFAAALTHVSTVVTPHVLAVQNLGVVLRRPCRCYKCGVNLT
jgi:hypothetical protein